MFHRRASLGTLMLMTALLGVGMGGLEVNPKENEKPEPTPEDKEALSRAERKRERKAKRNKQNKK